MTKQGLLAFDGYVTHANQGGLVYVTLNNNVAMLAKVGGNVREAFQESLQPSEITLTIFHSSACH